MFSNCLNYFFEVFGLQFASHIGLQEMIEEFILQPPFSKKWRFLWQAKIYVVM